MNNEERFIASCKTVGEADVRAKVISGRYSEQKASWAAAWLERVENAKSDSVKAAESNNRLRDLHRSQHRDVARKIVPLVILVAGVVSVIICLG